jgi:ABC-type sugar transport system substrate-binding protein
MNQKRCLTVLLAMIMIAVFLVSCAAPAATTTQKATTAAATTAAATTAAKKIRIGVTLPTLAAVHFVNQQYGYELAGKELGVEVTVVHAGGYENVEKQVNQIQDFIAAGMDGIIVAATNADGVVKAEEEAIAKGIPVINVNNMSNTDKIFAQIRSDDTAMGSMCADIMGEKLGGKGNIVLVNAAAGTSNTIRGDSFRKQLNAKFPNMKIIVEQNIAPDAAKATAAMEDFLQTYPDIQGVFSWADTVAIPMSNVIKTSGRPIVIVTIDASNPDTRTRIRDGVIFAAVAQQPVTLGKLGIQTLVKIIKKEPYEKKIFSPIIAVTKDNIATLDLSGIVIPGQK